MKIITSYVELLWMTPDPLQEIERAGRTCYKSEAHITEESAQGFVRGIIDRGHEAVIEMAEAAFRIVCDRGVTHEIVRHRLASYCQESTRYCNYSQEKFGREITVIMPPGLDAHQRDHWETACKQAENDYLAMIDHGASPQIARSVLPNCLKTEIIMKCNFREWRHFLKLRTSPKAHPQMREVAYTIGDCLRRMVPVVFEDVMTGEGCVTGPAK